MKIVLLEFIDEALALLKERGKALFLDKDVTIVCLHPSVRAFLKKMGIETADTQRYLNNDAQHRIILKSEESTVNLLEDFKIIDSLGLEESYREVCIHHIRLYINHFLWIIEILKGIYEIHKMSDLYCVVPKNSDRMYTDKVYIQKEERFMSFLAKSFCTEHGIKFHGLAIETRKDKIIASWAAKAVRIAGVGLTWLNLFFLMERTAADKKVIIVPATSYRMGRLVKEIKERHKNVVCVMIWEGKQTLKQELYKVQILILNMLEKMKNKNVLDFIISLDLMRQKGRKNDGESQKIEKEFEKFGKQIQSDKGRLFTHEGVPFGKYLQEKMIRGLRCEIISNYYGSRAIHEILTRIKPKLMMAMYSNGIYSMMGELSRKLGFRSLNISHGTHVPPNNEFEKIENYRLAQSVILNSYEYVAVQTPWTNKFLDYYEDKRPRIFSGPLLYSAISGNGRGELKKAKRAALGLPLDKHVIVYASTQKTRNGFRFHIAETLDEYISSLCDLIRSVDALENAYLVIRPHPACELSEDELRILLPASERFRFITKGPFSDVLSLADLLISYSSTCIEEALQNNIPVVLLDKWKRYDHFNIAETMSSENIRKAPVYYITSPEILRDSLDRILGIFSRDPLNETELEDFKFPKRYRTHFSEFVDRVLQEERDTVLV